MPYSWDLKAFKSVKKILNFYKKNRYYCYFNLVVAPNMDFYNFSLTSAYTPLHWWKHSFTVSLLKTAEFTCKSLSFRDCSPIKSKIYEVESQKLCVTVQKLHQLLYKNMKTRKIALILYCAKWKYPLLKVFFLLRVYRFHSLPIQLIELSKFRK